MLARLEASVNEYRALDRLATSAYRQATDLGEWYRWDEMTRCFTEELAFYREQAGIAARGAEVLYLGLDGPVSDATNAFRRCARGVAQEGSLVGAKLSLRL